MSENTNAEVPGAEILDDFERFSPKNDVFRRSWWDDRIRNRKTELFYATYRDPLQTWRKADGFTQKDYALRNAAWHVSDLFTEMKQDEDRREGFSDVFTLQRDAVGEKIDPGTPEETAAEIKRVARAFGAGAVGITQYDERWQYATRFSDMSLTEKPPEVDESLAQVIVVAQPME